MKKSRNVQLIVLLLAMLLGGMPSWALSQPALAQSNPIVLENQNPGTSNWRINFNIGTFSDDVNNQIKGYASATSVNQGANINFHITVNPVQSYNIDIFRMGWYGGAGGRLMQSVSNLSGVSQPACPVDAATGMVTCNWGVSYSLAVPANWTTGIYVAKLTNSQGYQSYILFVVRNDNRVADFVYEQPVNTYQAYNNYPSNGTTGKSLYDFNSYGAPTAAGTQRANKVSFDRPYGGNGGYDGGGQFIDDQWWERYFISWAERMGYDISYTTDVDTQVNASRLLNFKGVLVPGHSEYWTKQMYDAHEAARNAGVNLAFWGANPIYWQVRYEPSASGVPNRVLVGYKSPTLDPIADPALKTDQWRFLNRAEQQLVGVQYTIDGDFSATQPYIIKNSSHWVWANSGFVDGSVVSGILGYEVDRLYSQYPAPNSLSYTTLAESPYVATTVNPPINETSQSSIYQAPSGAWVFAAGTMSWSWALDRPGYVNTGIQQAAQNIMDRFLIGNTPPTPTNTPIVPTDTPTNTPVVPTDTPTNTPVVPTDTPVVPTDTPTNTPVVPIDTPTNTPVVPIDTPTNTAVAPTATRTNTPIPPSATPTPTATAAGGINTNITYKIIARHSRKLVSANPSMAATNGQKIIQYSDIGASWQQWRFVSAGNGYYYIVSPQNGRALDISGSTQTAGEQLQLWQLNNGTNQQWRVVNASTTGYVNIIVRHSGQYMDVSGAGTTDYTSILQWPATGNTNQQWQLVPVGNAPTPTNTPVSQPTPTPLTGTVDKRISQSSDDAEESRTSGTMSVNSSDIELGYDLGLTNTYQWSGLRFQNVTIPRGATISSAYIEFTTASADAFASGNLVIRGQASDNPTAFTTTRYNISSRSRTNASVNWLNVAGWRTNNEKNSTPSIRTIVQELVNRNGWNSGNSMVFIIDGTGRHSAYSYDNNTSKAARLVIQWTSARSVMPEMPSEYLDEQSGTFTPSVAVEFDTAAPGSTVRLLGEHFTPNSPVTLLLGNAELATVQTDEFGHFLYQLSIGSQQMGSLTLSVAGKSELVATLQVGSDLPLRTVEAGEYSTDEGVQNKRVYLPFVSAGN